MTPEAAVDEMLAVFKAAWDTTGFGARVAWTDVPSAVPSGEQPWARVTVQHALGRQTSLAGANGVKRHTHTGTLWVQVFGPMGNGNVTAYGLAKTVLDAYRTARGSVWYRNQRLREAGSSGAFQQINVLVDFTYDDF